MVAAESSGYIFYSKHLGRRIRAPCHHAPRGIHLSLRSMLVAVARGDGGKCQAFFLLFLELSGVKKRLCVMGRYAVMIFPC